MTDDKLIVYTGGVLTKGVAEAEDAAAAAAAAAELAGGEADRAELAADDAQAAADALAGAIGDIATAQETADDALSAADSAIATQARRDFGKWHLVDYLHPDDMAAALEGNVAGQDESRVTSAIQQMFFDFFTFWSGGNNRNAEIVFPKAALAINDELLGEDSAQILWDMTGSNNGACRVTIQTNGVEFYCRNWVARARIRTSGFYAAHGIDYAVPTVVFRWEQQAQNSWYPEFSGKWSIVGQSSIANDPVGVLVRNSRQPKMRGLEVRRLYNHMFMSEGVMNGDFDDLDLFWGGYQPTEFGGTWGHMPAAVRFSNTGAVVTATEAVFTADHVGKQFCLAQSGAPDQGTRLNHWSVIASVDSDTQITLTDAPAVNASGQTGSFEAMRVSCAANSSVCTMSAAISGDLTGRYVTIVEAHTTSALRSGTVTSVIVSHSGDQITLAHELAEAVEDRLLIFSPMLWADAVPENSQARNDNLGFGNLRCESTGSSVNASVPAVFGRTGSIVAHNAKLHGCAPTSNNFGGTPAAAVFGHARGVVFDGSLEQGGNSPRWANGMFVGNQMIIQLLGKITAYPDSNTSAYTYIAPTVSPSSVESSIYWGLNPPSPVWPQQNQTPFRLGTNGRDYMISAYGSERGSGIFPSRFGEIVANEISGDSVVSSNTDTTSGRLMTVGYGGNTGGIQPGVAADLNSIQGQHRRVRATGSTTNKPDSDNYIVDAICNTPTTTLQIAYSMTTTRKIAVRNNFQGSWTAWTFISAVLSGGTGGRPSSPYPWQQYADTTLGHPIWWNGSAWVDATGTTV